MNFNVIDGTNVVLSTEDLIALETDYMESPLSSVEVRRKYNLSKKQYSEITQRIRDKYGLIKRPYPNCKYYYRQNNHWTIIKTVDGEKTYFGSLSCDIFNEEEIKNIVESCKEMGWNIDRCREFIRILGGD